MWLWPSSKGRTPGSAAVVGVVSLSNNNSHLEQSLRNVLEDSNDCLAAI